MTHEDRLISLEVNTIHILYRLSVSFCIGNHSFQFFLDLFALEIRRSRVCC